MPESTLTLDEVLASDQVPSLPEVALRIIEVAQQQDPDTQQLIGLVRSDPAIAGRILKFANSALFGLRHRPTSIEAAVPMLGTTLVRTLTLGFSLAQQTPVSDGLRPWFRQLWRESLFQASAAELLAERVEGADPPTWFLAGLLQDVGQLAMLNVAQVEYFQNVLDRGHSECRFDLEKERFGFTHVEVSVGLCKKWNLDPAIVAAVGAHHGTVKHPIDGQERSLTYGLQTASCCAEYMEAIYDRLETTRADVERALIQGFECFPHQVTELLADMDHRATDMAAGFGVNIGDMPSRGRILARAQSVLRDIAIDTQLRNLAGSKSPQNDDAEEPDRRQWQAWLDEDLSTYNRQYLDKALPAELQRAHSDGTVVGLLQVDFSAATDADQPTDPSEIIALIKESVRPTDSVIRGTDSSAVLIMPGLNYDLLAGIAERIQTQINERLDLPDSDPDSAAVGGVVVVPAGRRVAEPVVALDLLDDCVDKASDQGSKRIAFQLLMGKKATPLG